MFKFIKQLFNKNRKFPNTKITLVTAEDKEIAKVLLQRARVRIEDRDSVFVCHALTDSARDGKQYEVSYSLRNCINLSLDGAGTMEGWLMRRKECDVMTILNVAKANRLLWIDDMIAKLSK
jgi:hypothetical protein